MFDVLKQESSIESSSEESSDTIFDTDNQWDGWSN